MGRRFCREKAELCLENGLRALRGAQGLQAHEHGRHQRVPARNGAVVRLLRAEDQRFVIPAVEIKPAVVIVIKIGDGLVRHALCAVEIRPVQRRIMERQQRIGIARIIVEKSALPAPAVPLAHKEGVAPAQPRFYEALRRLRRAQVVRVAADAVEHGERCDHQRVPERENLVVGMEAAARKAIAPDGGEQRVEGRFQRFGVQQVGDAPPLKVAPGRDAVMAVERFAVLLAQQVGHFLRPQQVEPALLAAAVRVLRAVEAPVRRRHLLQNIERGLFRDLPVDGLLRDLMGAAERDHHQRVVVQHLFKVRNEEIPIRGVAAKPVSDMVEQAAAIHLQERGFRHAQRLAVALLLIALHQKQQVVGRGKLRRAAKAAVAGVVALPKEGRRFVGKVRVRRGRRRRFRESGQNAVCRLQQRGSVALPCLMDAKQQLLQPDGTMARILREIRPGKERPLIGGHEDRGRPSAAAGKRLTHRHVHAVDIRALLPVHLDGNKVYIEDLRDFLILKALVRHHVAPMAGAVADAQKDGLVLPPGLVKRLAAPGVPVHGILGMLQEIGACLLFEMVAHALSSSRYFWLCGMGRPPHGRG